MIKHFTKWIKSLRKKEEKFFPTPYRYCIIDWSDYGKKHGTIDKKIQIIESNEIAGEEPFSKSKIATIIGRMPIFDATQGMRSPTFDIIDEIDPSTIKRIW